jgi:large subunit ribosomal protein L23
MALFSRNKETKEKAAPKAVAAKADSKPVKKAAKPAKETKAVALRAPSEVTKEAMYADVIIRPRITEKAGMQAEKSVFTFEVTKKATKKTVAKAVQAFYGKKPEKVNIVNLPAKSVFVRGKAGSVPGVKKAVVFLKKGDTIEFI